MKSLFSLTFLTFCGLTVFSQNPFCFNTATNVAAQQMPQSVITADFNNDGNKDFSVTNYNTGSISIRLGNGMGSFSGTNVSCTSPNDVTAADFNSDGNLDLAVARAYSIDTYWGNGTGGFVTAFSFSLPFVAVAITSADFNNDGKADLAAVGSTGTSSLSVLMGQGTGSFNAANSYSAPNAPSDIEAGDFNNDGKIDLVTANSIANKFALYANIVSGIFTSPALFNVGADAQGITVNDFNNDGNKDVAVTGYNTGKVYLFLGTGAFNFVIPSSFSVGTNPIGITSADFNGDGFADVASANYGGNDISVLPGTGGSFLSAVVYSVGTNPFIIASEDFDNDGTIDLAVANEGSNNVSILINRTAKITPSGPTTFCSGGNVVLGANKGASSYLWQPGGSIADSLIVSAAGVYTLTVNNGTCSSIATQSITVNTCTGIEELSGNLKFGLFPNPVQERFTLSTDAAIKNCWVDITDVLGRVVKHEPFETISVFFDFNDQPKGIYFMKVIIKEQQVYSTKIIKQ